MRVALDGFDGVRIALLAVHLVNVDVILGYVSQSGLLLVLTVTYCVIVYTLNLSQSIIRDPVIT